MATKTATIKMTKDAVKKGKYKDTSIDKSKKKADALLISIDGDYYSLFLQNDVKIPYKRGVKWYNKKSVAVTESVFSKLSQKYVIMCDF